MLASTTALLWALQALTLQSVLRTMDPYTLGWYRFASTFVILSVFFRPTMVVQHLIRLRLHDQLMLGIAAIVLIGNFILYVEGLKDTNPSTAQILVQLGPMLSLLGGSYFFREKLSARQWGGILVLVLGLAVFFHAQLSNLLQARSEYAIGVALISCASLFWAIYALLQKKLNQVVNSNQMIWAICGLGSIVLFYNASPTQVMKFDTGQAMAFAFNCISMAVAYACFGESLRHIRITTVSTILALNPILTVLLSLAISLCWPAFIPAGQVGLFEILGASLVVVGSYFGLVASRKE